MYFSEFCSDSTKRIVDIFPFISCHAELLGPLEGIYCINSNNLKSFLPINTSITNVWNALCSEAVFTVMI